LTNSALAPENNFIPTELKSDFPGAGSNVPEEPSSSTVRLILLWYAGLAASALFIHWALGTGSAVVASALAAAAVVIPLTLLAYTMRSYGSVFDSRILVPALGPVVILLLIFEYVEYNKQVDEAYSAQLIPANLLMLSDVKLAHGNGRSAGRLSGHVVNRSPHELVGISLEFVLFGGSEKLSSAVADAKIDVAPGQQGNFAAPTPGLSAATLNELPCTRAEALPPPSRQNRSGMLECYYRVAGTRGEEITF